MAEIQQDQPTNGQTEASAAGAASEQAPPPEPTLTEKLVNEFDQGIHKEGEKAYRRWGFALFHSLAPERRVEESMRLGFKPTDPLDHYNLGCHYAQQLQFDKAVEEFSQALKAKPGFLEAQYNLALSQEMSGDLVAARKTWNAYLEKCENAEEAAEIKDHLTELANK
jgi:tetratricopeptide (TPR) repeat protein